jgi:hypothetical protein
MDTLEWSLFFAHSSKSVPDGHTKIALLYDCLPTASVQLPKLKTKTKKTKLMEEYKNYS